MSDGRNGNWGRWGDDDERGALNLLTPEVVAEAAKSIRTGKVYSLGIPIQREGVPLMDYRGTPMRLTLQDGTDDGMYAPFGCGPGTGAHEDVLVMASHTTSHMDALVHVYTEHQHYNGVSYDTMHALTGAQRLGIDKVGALAGRAVLLDMVRYFGADGCVEGGTNISSDDLRGAAAQAGVEVRAGDTVLVRTGWLDVWFAAHAAGEAPPMLQAGIGLDAAQWLVDNDVVAVASDNSAVECIPFDGNDFLAVHKLLLVEAGVYMIEHLDLSGPAADGVGEGFFTVGPLKVTGATGSPVNPVLVA